MPFRRNAGKCDRENQISLSQVPNFQQLWRAILNIITNKNAKNYLSATYTNSTSFTSYDDVRWRMNNSLLLSAKNKYFGWQLNVGQEKARFGPRLRKKKTV
jgi:hypothetical protein